MNAAEIVVQGRLNPDGTLELDQKLALPVGPVEITVRTLVASDPAMEAERQHENLERLQKELAALPVMNPADGFSNRDHDDLLYGRGS